MVSPVGDRSKHRSQRKRLRAGLTIQSIIEAPRKNAFFHDGGIATNIEDAASFYFTTAFEEFRIGGLLLC